MLVQSSRVLAAVLCVGMVAGCSGPASPQTVSGKVTLDGAPLPAASLTMVPKDESITDPAIRGPFVGKTDDQGEFSIGPINEPGGGAPAGAYKLTITTAFVEAFDENSVVPAERIPEPHRSGVDFEVPAGGTSDANFELKSK
jgi:hypothetical protein